jgi:hypothetical protein
MDVIGTGALIAIRLFPRHMLNSGKANFIRMLRETKEKSENYVNRDGKYWLFGNAKSGTT